MKTLLSILIIVCPVICKAQIEKGSWMVGGSSTISFLKEKGSPYLPSESRSVNFSLAPSIGYFIVKNLAAGIRSTATLSRTKNLATDFSGESKTIGWYGGLGPFVRYYIPIKKIFIVTEATYQYNWSHYKQKVSDGSAPETTSKASFKSFRFAAGPAFFLNPNVSVEVLANYSHNITHTTIDNTFYLTAGFQIYIRPKSE